MEAVVHLSGKRNRASFQDPTFRLIWRTISSVVTSSLRTSTLKARKPESIKMSERKDEPDTLYANINLKVGVKEKWDFKEWCVRHRLTQVDAFREAFELLKEKHDREDKQ